MNTKAETKHAEIMQILHMMESLHERRSPDYAKALDSIITRLPDSDDRELLRQHQQQYLAELEAQQ